MAIYKCKMCGGELSVKDREKVIECEYCGTQQTLPSTTDENIQGLFNRANLLRQKNEFDKAELIYEKIIQSDETESEAYWGVILCKFGIEYVEDPKTYKRIPTCHRTSYDSIIADEYYKKAIQYADVVQRNIYEKEAMQIDEIQKGILAISANEEPYDVFICYKETDSSGSRTKDSVIANEIYHNLTNEGFKVFYAAITLEDKLGSAYEPIIFAALNSAKVMLSIGTKPEYFNAVWVKNEWSRFLKIMKNDHSKMLIPCYKDMDAYELPEEFSHLQAQDMSKIGFINDIVRGIKKIIKKPNDSKEVSDETMINKKLSSLLKRCHILIEDGDYDKAYSIADNELNDYPENAEIYEVLLLSEFKHSYRQIENIDDKNLLFKFFENKNLIKIFRFGNENLVNKYKSLVIKISNKIEKGLVGNEFFEESFKCYCKLIENLSKYENIFEEEINKLVELKDSLVETYYNEAVSIYETRKDNSLCKKMLTQVLNICPQYKDAEEIIGELNKCEKWFYINVSIENGNLKFINEDSNPYYIKISDLKMLVIKQENDYLFPDQFVFKVVLKTNASNQIKWKEINSLKSDLPKFQIQYKEMAKRILDDVGEGIKYYCNFDSENSNFIPNQSDFSNNQSDFSNNQYDERIDGWAIFKMLFIIFCIVGLSIFIFELFLIFS